MLTISWKCEEKSRGCVWGG